VDESHIPLARVFQFENFELDLRTLELRKNDQKVKLEGQPLRILALLVERPGELVTREELRNELWPRNAVVDFEHSINAGIKRLREALGDCAESPRLIETLPRRGYRFLQPVKTGPMPSSAMRMPASLAMTAPRLRGRFATLDDQAGSIALAVLPLKNLSGDPGQDYYADGISEALITELGKIASFRVLSFQSVSRYRRTATPLPEIASELGVEALLEGSVLRSGARVRITAKLFQAAPEHQLLSETYEFDAPDILAVQAAVARDVAGRTRVRLTAQEEARLAIARRVEPAAYEAYLLARAYSSKSVPGGLTNAKEYYERAIAVDETYASAYGGLAELYAAFPCQLLRVPRQARSKSRQLAEKALSLDHSLAGAHAALARVAQQEWDWPAAERRYQRATEVNPSYSAAWIGYAMFLYAMERFDEAVAQARRAQQLDPASALVNTWAGAAYFFAGLEDEALATWQLALELDPKYGHASLALARSQVSRGRHAEAISVLEKALSYAPKDAELLGARAHALARIGRRAEALKVVSDLDERHAKDEIMPPFGRIWACGGLGDHDRAFAHLQEAYEEGRDRMVWLKVDPLLAPLRTDPRFHSLVKRMNMPPVTRAPA
jgi:TolB-like protein/DNA-binding winged helix-turn-helix (wHTH) protein/Tfp pilus assembly protein PilF